MILRASALSRSEEEKKTRGGALYKKCNKKCYRGGLCRDAGGAIVARIVPAKAFTVNGPGVHVRIGHHPRHDSRYDRGGGGAGAFDNRKPDRCFRAQSLQT
jgi:hypothetical protein